MFKNLFLGVVFLLFTSTIFANTGRYRLMFNNDPATEITIGWEQISGSNQKVYFGLQDHGTNRNDYSDSIAPYRSTVYQGMNNQFAVLSGLQANTVYYFVIGDSEGTSERYWFRTCPNDGSTPLSFISGGDSRSGYTQRINANKMVAKIRPHAVLFGGDLTNIPSDNSTQDWMDHWQETITSDGQMIPTVHSFGNHESMGTGGANYVRDLFDTPMDTYYKVTFGGNLFSVYTLNGEVMPNNTLNDATVRQEQADWLANTLPTDDAIWKAAQYHRPMMPHNSSKVDGFNEYQDWAQLFYDHGVRLVMESDAHVVKVSQEVKPQEQAIAIPNSTTWFTTDGLDQDKGITFIGEGSWGTLRDDDKTHNTTLVSGSFYQFNWIVVTPCQILVRSVDTQNPDDVPEHAFDDYFSISNSLDVVLWKPTQSVNGVFEINKCAKPFASFKVEQNNICAGESIAFSNQSLNNPTSYSWNFGDGTNSTEENPNHTFSTPGVYDVELTATNAIGEDTRVLRKLIVVNGLPELATNNDTIICQGNSLVLNVSGADEYQWNEGLTEETEHTVSPTISTTYEVIGTTNGCSSTQAIVVEVSEPAEVTVSGNSSICAGEEVEISAQGADEYSWDQGLGEGASHLVQPSESTIYTVSATNGACTTEETVTIDVTALPELSFNAPMSICKGASATIEVTGASSYSWNNNLPDGNTQEVSPMETTVYTVSGSNGDCSANMDITIEVVEYPQISFEGLTNVCAGEQVELTAFGAETYDWNNGASLDDTYQFTAENTTSFDLSASNGECTVSQTIDVLVKPTPELTVSLDTSLCFGDSTTLTVSGADAYSWSNGLGNEDTQIVSPGQSTVFQVEGTTDGCSSLEEIEVSVFELPIVSLEEFSAPTICLEQGKVMVPLGHPVGGEYSGNGVDGTMFDPALADTGIHLVQYVYTDDEGCTNSAEVMIEVVECLGIQEGDKTIFKIYPNPASNYVRIEKSNNTQVSDLVITDAQGKLVLQSKIEELPMTLDVSAWAKGTYYFQFHSNGKAPLLQKIIID